MNALAASRDLVPMGAPLRIALVHASDFGGGAERSVVDLHRGLRALGHASTLFVGEQRTSEPGVQAIPYLRGLPGTRRAARWLERGFGWQDIYNPSFRGLRRLLRGRFDLVHFNSLWGSAGFADIGALPGITGELPGVITMRENWLITGHCACFHQCQRWRTGCGQCPDLTIAPALPRDGTRWNWQRKQSIMRRSRLHVVAISDWLKEQAEASPILATTQVSRIYNGIDFEVFKPPALDERAAARAQLGIGQEEIVVLLAGQTVEGIRTGIATAHAIAALAAVDQELRLRPLVVGHSAARVAESLGVRAIVLPFQSSPTEMARCFQLADLSLVTSEVEAFGRIAAESQACGTPVVAFGAGGIPEVVRNGAGGIVVPVGDIAGISDGLRRLGSDPELRATQARLGLEHVHASFDQGRVARQYIELYSRLIDRNRNDG
jgi:glycosyltransferase involved in cell wall biosynthesis